MLSKRKKIRRREENPWGSSTFFETPKYPRATDNRSHSVFEIMYPHVIKTQYWPSFFERCHWTSRLHAVECNKLVEVFYKGRLV